MDDIIVLILTLIFIVAGIFGQMKKRQLPSPEPLPEEEQEKENFWDMLDEELEEEQPRPQFKKTEYMGDDYASQVTASKFQWDKEGRNFSHDLTKSDPIKHEFPAPKKKRFPLKKAVIYSEILNRKHFKIS
jgi:hypothetical protein